MNGEQIKELRIALGWTQEQLAKEVGVSWTTANRWERDVSKPSPMARQHLERLQRRQARKPSDG